jgi:hypothetical protein
MFFLETQASPNGSDTHFRLAADFIGKLTIVHLI